MIDDHVRARIASDIDRFTGSFTFPAVIDTVTVHEFLKGMAGRYGPEALPAIREALTTRLQAAQPGAAPAGGDEPVRPRFGTLHRLDGSAVPLVFHPAPDDPSAFVGRYAADESEVTLVAGETVTIDVLGAGQTVRLLSHGVELVTSDPQVGVPPAVEVGIGDLALPSLPVDPLQAFYCGQIVYELYHSPDPVQRLTQLQAQVLAGAVSPARDPAAHALAQLHAAGRVMVMRTAQLLDRRRTAPGG